MYPHVHVPTGYKVDAQGGEGLTNFSVLGNGGSMDLEDIKSSLFIRQWDFYSQGRVMVGGQKVFIRVMVGVHKGDCRWS